MIEKAYEKGLFIGIEGPFPAANDQQAKLLAAFFEKRAYAVKVANERKRPHLKDATLEERIKRDKRMRNTFTNQVLLPQMNGRNILITTAYALTSVTREMYVRSENPGEVMLNHFIMTAYWPDVQIILDVPWRLVLAGQLPEYREEWSLQHLKEWANYERFRGGFLQLGSRYGYEDRMRIMEYHPEQPEKTGKEIQEFVVKALKYKGSVVRRKKITVDW